MAVDLVERLTSAAAEAIANERPSLEYEPARLRGVVLELELDDAGVVTSGTLYVERRVRQRMTGRLSTAARATGIR